MISLDNLENEYLFKKILFLIYFLIYFCKKLEKCNFRVLFWLEKCKKRNELCLKDK